MVLAEILLSDLRLVVVFAMALLSALTMVKLKLLRHLKGRRASRNICSLPYSRQNLNIEEDTTTKQAALTSGPRIGNCRPAVNLLSRRKHHNEDGCFASCQHISDMLITNMRGRQTTFMRRGTINTMILP
jgi:hypothetical protein